MKIDIGRNINRLYKNCTQRKGASFDPVRIGVTFRVSIYNHLKPPVSAQYYASELNLQDLNAYSDINRPYKNCTQRNGASFDPVRIVVTFRVSISELLTSVKALRSQV